MKLLIGETIRNLRRERNITQEEFANVLGVTYQSVSRWENNTCYPDMELLPDIANFFGITVDKLMGVDKNAEQKEIDRYLKRFQEAVSRGAVYECIDIAREGVTAYPNNYALLNKLMYALFLSGDDDGNIPEWRENMLKNDAEITELGERIMKYCPDQDIRLEAMNRLAFNHCEMGRKEIGRRIYETLPPMYSCRELCIWWALDDREKLENARDRIRKGYHILYNALYNLIYAQGLSDEERIKIYKKCFALNDLIWDGCDYLTFCGWGNARAHCGLSGIYARTNQADKAISELRQAVQYAKAFDERPETATFSALLPGKLTIYKTDFETDDSRSLSEIVRDKWLKSSDFDGIRNTIEFQSIIDELS